MPGSRVYADLSPEQVSALEVGKAEGLRLQEVDVTYGGIPRKIILLGELHVKIESSARREQELIRHFPLRMLEGDAGGGSGPTIQQAFIHVWISPMVLVSRLARSNSSQSPVGMSSLVWSRLTGLHVGPSGSLHYGTCRIGGMYQGRFYFSDHNIRILQQNWRENQKLEFFKTLQRFAQPVANTLASFPVPSGSDQLIFLEGGSHCPTSISPNGTVPFSVNAESGSLDVWNPLRACPLLICPFLTTTRDVRMAEAIYQFFLNLPAENVALVVVGAAHLNTLTGLLSNWPLLRSRYLKAEYR